MSDYDIHPLIPTEDAVKARDDFQQSNSGDLPDHYSNETLQEENLRISIMRRLLSGFAKYEEFWIEDLARWNDAEPQEWCGHVYGTQSYGLGLDLLYWFLNRMDRCPSNSTRPEQVETAAGTRRRILQVEHSKQLQKSGSSVVAAEGDDNVPGSEEELEPEEEDVPDVSEDEQGFIPIPPPPGLEQRSKGAQHLLRRVSKSAPDAKNIPQLDPAANLKNIGTVDYINIIRHLISRVNELHNDRYSPILGSEYGQDVQGILEQGLRQPVKDMCVKGTFDLESLRSIGIDRNALDGAGTYMNILWKRRNPNQFWLYVGQAVKIRDRLHNHNNKAYRQRHPSLHYNVWDSSDEMESEFVILATQEYGSKESHLVLNMQEMLMACIFQTLTGPVLKKYMPSGTDTPWAGRHLNVLPPIWQRLPSEVDSATEIWEDPRDTFEAYLRSEDPILRKWARDGRDAYNDLRHSPDSKVRKYYSDHVIKRLKLAQKTVAARVCETAALHASERQNVMVKKSSHQLYVSIGKHIFNIGRSLHLSLNAGDLIGIQLHPNMPSSIRYAVQAIPADPSHTLAVSISGTDSSGNEFHGWLRNKGERTPMRMNTLVDSLEGRMIEELEQLPRRWLLTALYPGRTKRKTHLFTDDDGNSSPSIK